MTKDEILRLAHEADDTIRSKPFTAEMLSFLERFATLCRAPLVAENKLLWVSREEPSQRAALYMSECNRLEGERDEYRQKYNDTLAALGDCSEGHAELGAENEGLKESFESVLSQLKERDAELEQAKKDAERYRWFADIAVGGSFEKAEDAFAVFADAESCSYQELDAAIDAAIAKEQS